MAVPLQSKNQTPQLPKQGRESYLMSMSKIHEAIKLKAGYCSLVRLQSCPQISEQNTACALHGLCIFFALPSLQT